MNETTTDRAAGVTFEEAQAWAARTRSEQGLPLHVSDPAIIHKVQTLLRSRRRAPQAVNMKKGRPAA